MLFKKEKIYFAKIEMRNSKQKIARLENGGSTFVTTFVHFKARCLNEKIIGEIYSNLRNVASKELFVNSKDLLITQFERID